MLQHQADQRLHYRDPRRRREKGAENFPNLGKETDTQTQETQTGVPNKRNPKRPTPQHIKMSKVKDRKRILKAPREKQLVTHRGTTPPPTWVSAD